MRGSFIASVHCGTISKQSRPPPTPMFFAALLVGLLAWPSPRGLYGTELVQMGHAQPRAGTQITNIRKHAEPV